MLERCVVWLGSGFRGLASALHPARVLLLVLLLVLPGGGKQDAAISGLETVPRDARQWEPGLAVRILGSSVGCFAR